MRPHTSRNSTAGSLRFESHRAVLRLVPHHDAPLVIISLWEHPLKRLGGAAAFHWQEWRTWAVDRSHQHVPDVLVRVRFRGALRRCQRHTTHHDVSRRSSASASTVTFQRVSACGAMR
eukprot:335733-Rhodomonas_salina.2